MSQPRIVHYGKHTLALGLAVLYLLAPLQQSILEGLHSISHAMHHIDSLRHHHRADHTLNKEHSHEHETLSLVASWFDAFQAESDDSIVVHAFIDKHFPQLQHIWPYSLPSSEEKYLYPTSRLYPPYVRIPTPPPQA